MSRKGVPDSRRSTRAEALRGGSQLVGAMARGQGAGAEWVRGRGTEKNRKGSGLDLEGLVGSDFELRLSWEYNENHWEFLSRKMTWIRLTLGRAHHGRYVGKDCAGIRTVVARGL